MLGEGIGLLGRIADEGDSRRGGVEVDARAEDGGRMPPERGGDGIDQFGDLTRLRIFLAEPADDCGDHFVEDFGNIGGIEQGLGVGVGEVGGHGFAALPADVDECFGRDAVAQRLSLGKRGGQGGDENQCNGESATREHKASESIWRCNERNRLSMDAQFYFGDCTRRGAAIARAARNAMKIEAGSGMATSWAAAKFSSI